MRSIGAMEAEKTLGSLLDLVENGENVEITRNGRVIAKLMHVQPPGDRETALRAVERMKELRKGLSLEGLSIREMIDEGRR